MVARLKHSDRARPAARLLPQIVVAAGLFFLVYASASLAQAIEPLHQRIDALTASGHAGIVAPPAGDGEYLRRLSLDLVGVIPTAIEARALFDDPSSEKRSAAVDRFLADPRHARHMAQSFDVMLMERRPEKNVTVAEWQAYLYNSFVAEKPLDELAREILSADGVDPVQRAPARFLLDRDAEPNLLTRDVGRIFLGRDMQCAQCHDHPIISDYFQNDYHALFAFFDRTELFTGADKKVVLAERAASEVAYKSVFTDVRGITRPRVPGGKQVDEPRFNPGEEWTVAPAKDVRHVPKFSRRGQLAAEVTASRHFARNMANRLWTVLFGRGLVDPVDLHHAENPPSNPQLLEMLTDELIANKFRYKPILREIAVSQTYQRSIDVPADWRSLAEKALSQLPGFVAEREGLTAAVAASKAALEKLEGDLTAARQPIPTIVDELAKAVAAVAPLQKAADDAAKALAAAQAQLAASQSAQATVSEAAVKAAEAAAKLPAEKELADAAAKFKARSEQFPAEIDKLTKSVADLTPPSAAAIEALAAGRKPVDEITARLDAARAAVAAIEPPCDAARVHANFDLAQLKSIERRVTAAETLVKLSNGNPADAAQAETANALVEKAAREFALGSLRQLSPEQLAWSVMQATGSVQSQFVASAAEVNQALAAQSSPPDTAVRDRQIEQSVFGKLQPQALPIINLFASAAGQPQYDFFATVDQALFLANGDLLKSWLTPSGENLAARLAKIEDPKAFADELYLSVLTRRPTEAEVAAVSGYLTSRGDKPAAAGELAWSLLTSSEFRFNH